MNFNAAWHTVCIRDGDNSFNLMKNVNSPKSINPAKSTYSLLVRSEETRRNVFEALVYATFILCAVFSMWQFARQSVVFPNSKMASGEAIVHHFDTQRG